MTAVTRARYANKEVRELHREMVSLGWTLVRINRGGHGIYKHPAHAEVLTLPSTPSDTRWRANTLAALRRFHVKEDIRV